MVLYVYSLQLARDFSDAVGALDLLIGNNVAEAGNLAPFGTTNVGRVGVLLEDEVVALGRAGFKNSKG